MNTPVNFQSKIRKAAGYVTGLAVVVGVLFSAYDYWTKPPPTLSEEMLSDAITGKRLDDTISAYEERGYPRAKIEQTIVEVRLFIREVLNAAPVDEVKNIIAMKQAAEHEKRAKEAEDFPNVYHGGLFWRKLGWK